MFTCCITHHRKEVFSVKSETIEQLLQEITDGFVTRIQQNVHHLDYLSLDFDIHVSPNAQDYVYELLKWFDMEPQNDTFEVISTVTDRDWIPSHTYVVFHCYRRPNLAEQFCDKEGKNAFESLQKVAKDIEVSTPPLTTLLLMKEEAKKSQFSLNLFWGGRRSNFVAHMRFNLTKEGVLIVNQLEISTECCVFRSLYFMLLIVHSSIINHKDTDEPIRIQKVVIHPEHHKLLPEIIRFYNNMNHQSSQEAPQYFGELPDGAGHVTCHTILPPPIKLGKR